MQGLNPCVCLVNELIIISDDRGSIQNDNGLVTNCETYSHFYSLCREICNLYKVEVQHYFLMALDLSQREKHNARFQNDLRNLA